MEKRNFVEPLRMGRVGRTLVLLNVLLVASFFLTSLYYCSLLPEEVPTHWNLRGEVDAYGAKTTVFVLAAVLSIANILIILITTFRFKIINRYPYLISMPAIALLIGSDRLSPKEKGRYVNRVFEVFLATGCIAGAYLLGLQYVIFDATVSFSPLPHWFVWYVFGGIPFLLAPGLLLYRKIYRDLRTVVG